MMYFEMYRIKINNKTTTIEDFNYGVGEFDDKKRFWIMTPFGFNKTDMYEDAYPLLHNLLISRDYFDIDVEIYVDGEYVHFAKFENCIMHDKKFAPNDIISYEFSGSFESITEMNEKFLELTKRIIL